MTTTTSWTAVGSIGRGYSVRCRRKKKQISCEHTAADGCWRIGTGYLSNQQIGAVEEDLAFIVAALYEMPRDPKLVTRSKELEQRAIALFSRHDLYDLTLHGHRVPE